MLGLLRQAAAARAARGFPELGLSCYTADDLFHQDALHDAVMDALDGLVAASAGLDTVLIAGAPLRVGGGLFNCGLVIYGGEVLGVIPKSYLPSYREFYEKVLRGGQGRSTTARRPARTGRSASPGSAVRRRRGEGAAVPR